MQTVQTTQADGLFSSDWDSIRVILREVAESQRELTESAMGFKDGQKAFAESAKEFKEGQKVFLEGQKVFLEIAKEFKEGQKEIRELQRETDRQVKDVNRRFGDFYNRFGEMVEYMVAPNLRDKFADYGFVFHQVNTNVRIDDIKNNTSFEIDILLENGDIAILVEVKNNQRVEFIKDHIKRIEKMRKYADSRGDKRTFMGAIAGVVVTPYVKKYTLKQGLFLVEPSGETFNITQPEGEPREW